MAMDAFKVELYLKTLRMAYEGIDSKMAMDFVEAIDVALDAAAPPVGAGHCRWVRLPDADMMPYEHIGICANLSSAIDAMEDEGESSLDVIFEDGEIAAMRMALAVYRSVLMDVNREEIKRKLQEVRK